MLHEMKLQETVLKMISNISIEILKRLMRFAVMNCMKEKLRNLKKSSTNISKLYTQWEWTMGPENNVFAVSDNYLFIYLFIIKLTDWSLSEKRKKRKKDIVLEQLDAYLRKAKVNEPDQVYKFVKSGKSDGKVKLFINVKNIPEDHVAITHLASKKIEVTKMRWWHANLLLPF